MDVYIAGDVDAGTAHVGELRITDEVRGLLMHAGLDFAVATQSHAIQEEPVERAARRWMRLNMFSIAASYVPTWSALDFCFFAHSSSPPDGSIRFMCCVVSSVNSASGSNDLFGQLAFVDE